MAVGTQVIRGSVGVLVKINMLETMVGATGLKFDIEKPKGGIDTWLPSINGNFLEYTTTDGDLDEVGDYKISPVVTQGSFDGRGLGVILTVIDKHEKV